MSSLAPHDMRMSKTLHLYISGIFLEFVSCSSMHLILNNQTQQSVKMNILKSEDIEDIYFFEVNTKYISSNVLKISEISRVRLLYLACLLP